MLLAFCAIICGRFLIRRKFELIQVVGESMSPTFENENILLVRVLHSLDVKNLKEGDIIIVEQGTMNQKQGYHIIKRIARIIAVYQSSNHLVNSYVEVRGDNSQISIDSSEIGLIPAELIRGKVISRFK